MASALLVQLQLRRVQLLSQLIHKVFGLQVGDELKINVTNFTALDTTC